MVYLVSAIFEEHDPLSVPSQGPQLSQKYKGMIIMFFTVLSVITFIVLYGK